MTNNISIWHNPRCSKSRQTLQLLRENGVEPTIVEYLKTPPSEAEITDALARLGITAADLLRAGEAQAKELSLTKGSAQSEIISAMAAHPILIERPVVFTPKGAAIGRPPENVSALL